MPSIQLKQSKKKYNYKQQIHKDKKSDWGAPFLTVDIMFNIFMRLPAPEVHELRYCCKEWYKLIGSSRFIAAHLHHSNPSLIAMRDDMTLPGEVGNRYIHPDIIRIKGRKITIRNLRLTCRKYKMYVGKYVESSCNGLVLLEDKEGNLSVSNPVTSQMLTLPPCIQRRNRLSIKRGIAFVNSTGDYNVVSVVINEAGFLGCELLTLGSSTWEWVDSPFGQLFRWFLVGHNSISIKGVFHFMFNGFYRKYNDQELTYVMSFDTAEKKFYRSFLPLNCRMEELHEIHGYPSVVAPSREFNFSEWEILSLKDLSKGEWVKQYCIDLSIYGNRFPKRWRGLRFVATLENGRFLILEGGEGYGWEYFVYDVQLRRLKTLHFGSKWKYIVRPHVESLVPC